MQSIKTHGNPASSIDKVKLATIHLAFFLLFPGFFFYQTLLGLGVISAFLGGYFAIISLAIILPLIFFYLIDIKQGKNYFSTTDLYFYIFIFYFFFIVAINFISGANIIIVQKHLLSIIYFINIFIIFKIISLNDKKLKIISVSCLLAMSIIIFYFSVDGSFYLALLGTSKNPESVATYQGFSRSYLLTFVVTIAFIRLIKARILIYIIAAASLFLNSARSEFVAMLFLIPIIEIYYSEHKISIALCVLLITLVIGLNFEQIFNLLPNNRISELADLSHSSSANLRNYLALQAIHTINENPILGDYASYKSGDYSHNILSAWVDLGLFGFIFLLAILIRPALGLFFDGFFIRTKSGDFLLACSLICVSLLLVFTSTTFDNMLIGAALGAYSKYRCKKQYE
jgi:hypothetical protein